MLFEFDLTQLVHHLRTDVQEFKLQQQAAEWERYLSCTHLPCVDDTPGLHEYFAETGARKHRDLADVLRTCQVCFHDCNTK